MDHLNRATFLLRLFSGGGGNIKEGPTFKRIQHGGPLGISGVQGLGPATTRASRSKPAANKRTKTARMLLTCGGCSTSGPMGGARLEGSIHNYQDWSAWKRTPSFPLNHGGRMAFDPRQTTEGVQVPKMKWDWMKGRPGACYLRGFGVSGRRVQGFILQFLPEPMPAPRPSSAKIWRHLPSRPACLVRILPPA